MRAAAALGHHYRWVVWTAISLLAFNQNLQTFAYPVLVPSLLAELGLSYSLAGGLMSAYLLAMASLMIPVGMLFDRIGGRALTIGGLAVMSVGTLLFAVASSYPVALLSRALVGMGMAVAIVIPAPMLAFWFSKSQFASVLGLHVSLGKTGSIVATWLLPVLIGLLGWRLGYGVVSLFGPLALLVAMVLLADEPDDVHLKASQQFAVPRAAQQPRRRETQRVPLRQVVGNRDVLLLAVAQVFFLATYYGAINWLPTYFKVDVGLSEVDAGFTTGMILWGTIIGFALTGPAANLAGSCRPLYTGGAATTTALTVLFAGGILPALPSWTWAPTMLLYGLCLSNMMLVMPILTSIVSRSAFGTASGFAFAVSYLGPIASPPLVGAVADWTGSLTTALWVPVATGALAVVLSLFVKEGR